MKSNVIYQNTNPQAAAQTGTLNRLDEADWFYKKWPGLEEAPADPELTARERTLSRVLGAVRANYRKRHEEMKMPFPAARPFPEQKALIKACPAFSLLRLMPKCGLLHVHNVAALSPGGFLTLLRQWGEKTQTNPANYPPIYVLVKKDSSRRDLPLGTLFFATKNICAQCCEPLADFLQLPANENWLLNLISFASAVKADRVAYIWDEFNKMFARTGDLFNLEQFYLDFHIAAFEEMLENRIDYVELRSSLTAFCELKTETDQAHPDRTCTCWQPSQTSFDPWTMKQDTILPFLDVLLVAQQTAMKNYKDTHGTPRYLDLRIILAARRDLNPYDDRDLTKLLKKLDSAILISQMPMYRNLVIGFDFVSEEDRGQRSAVFLQELFYAKWGDGYPDPNDQGKIQTFINDNNQSTIPFRLDLPRIQLIDFYLHDGESLWASNRNMNAAAVASRHRIGHGFLLSKYPALVSLITEKVSLEGQKAQNEPHEPMLEVCPISNQILRYYPDLRAHGAYDLMKAGIQCVLATDDPLLFDNADPTFDFWEAYIGMGLPFYAIKGLLFNSYYCRCMQIEPNSDPPKTDKERVTEFNEQYWFPFLNEAAALIAINHWDKKPLPAETVPQP